MFFRKRNKNKQESTENVSEENWEEADRQLLPATPELLNLASEYKQLMFFYQAGIEQVTTKLQILNQEYQLSNDRNPIEDIQSRVKSIESIQKKMDKRGVPMTLQNIVTCLYDIAGIRVICPFIKDVYQISKVLLEQDDVELLTMKDYIQNPKPNGYRSLHLIVTVNVYFSNRKMKVPVELQIRTIAMNFWASLEHQLRYKKEYQLTDEMQKEIKQCGEIMADADLRMQKLADELPEFQTKEEVEEE